MLKTRYLHIKLDRAADGRYFLYAVDEYGAPYDPHHWKQLLFGRHAGSFYGTMLTEDNRNGVSGVLLNGWELVSLFSAEQFNKLIEWDWDEYTQLCLAAAPALYDSIIHKDWIPDFSVWEQDEFRWELPKNVLHEFDPSFWEQNVEGIPVQNFIGDMFHYALGEYLNRNREARSSFGEKLEKLNSEHLSAAHLAAYFDEESFQRWMGIKEDDTPFTIGLKLEEPGEAELHWNVTVFLRGKADPELFADYKDYSNYQTDWHDHEDKVELELERWLKLFPWLSNGKNGITSFLTEDEAWMFLTEASETLLALGVDILLPSWWQAMKNASMKVKARVKSSQSHRPSFVGLQSMLDYDWRISMNGVDLTEEEFHGMVEEKRKLVYIRGRWIKLDPQFIRHIQDMMKRAEKEGLHVRDLIEQELLAEEAGYDEELENPQSYARIQIELNRQWKQMIKQLRNLKEIPLADNAEGFHGELRPYQQLGMSWLLFLRRYGFGAILADDMGLGKTIQLISYLLKVREMEEGPALIICPTSVLGNWQKEIERFAPDMNVYLHYGPNRPKGEAFAETCHGADVVLTSYGLTHLDLEEFEAMDWSSISIDEAQNIKNAGTKQSRAVRKLKGKHHIALTGTPMENRLSELWSIFDFTNHGYLGSLGQFQNKYVLPIEKDDDKDKVRQLQAYIRPFLLRRTKRDEEVALNLPDKLEQKEYCPLTAEQASLYEQLVRDTFAQIETLTGLERRGMVLQLLGRLKQLCNHPGLYLKEEKPKSILSRSSKLEKLHELISAVREQGESCLIFTQYIEMGRIIQQMLKNEFQLDVPFLNGSVPKQERDNMIARFQNEEFPVFLLSLKAGGTGLNLTAASHVIHFDRWWNPAVENQATDRAYRIGQKRFVHVHKLISTGTLEEKIDVMLEKKQSLNDQIIQSESWITELSNDELHDLVYLS
ncbi:DEAD/DEAH box helicase [Bacillus mesophilum]|uniref:DEAD/DEAH box helicase n=1 Tax=Bacillus mesophilum TaxID=1071718 RepID=A0A7V7RM73_9BACI|nr:DEAD/DEAH box helicase [Bacillus mesophilum]KAB2333029.1 DEAD/DEAH box helicase [Bacillus mesophilum]